MVLDATRLNEWPFYGGNGGFFKKWKNPHHQEEEEDREDCILMFEAHHAPRAMYADAMRTEVKVKTVSLCQWKSRAGARKRAASEMACEGVSLLPASATYQTVRPLGTDTVNP